MLEGVNSVVNFISAYDESQLNLDAHFLSRSVFFFFFFFFFLFPKAIFLTNISLAL